MPRREPAAGGEGPLVTQPPAWRRWEQRRRWGLGARVGGSCPRGRGAAVPAAAAARAGAAGGGRRAGTRRFYGLSRDVFIAGTGRQRMLPSPARATQRVPAPHPGADGVEDCARTLLSEVGLPSEPAAPRPCPPTAKRLLLLPAPTGRDPAAGRGGAGSCPGPSEHPAPCLVLVLIPTSPSVCSGAEPPASRSGCRGGGAEQVRCPGAVPKTAPRPAAGRG